MARQVANPGQRITADQAAAMVQSGMWLDYGAVLCQPDEFDKALARRTDALKSVKIRACLSTRPRAVMTADQGEGRFFWFNSHFGGVDRKMSDAGLAGYLPVNLGEVPDYYRRFIDPVDIVVIRCAPMDKDGYFSFGPANLWHGALTERAKCVIVEECATMPRVMGPGSSIHVSEVDYIIPGDNAPLPELPKGAASDVDRAVAQLIAAEMEDGDCLQIGIGGMPNAVCSLLAHSTIHDLGVHTEMLTDGIIDLYKSGKISGARKQLDPGKIVCSFGLGSKSPYDTIDGNPDIAFHPVDYTNAPHVIMQNDRVISINNTTQVDLQGQAASESDGFRHISGTGGQLQFVRGAYASRGGKSFICLSSTYDKKGEPRSRIVLALTRGNIVTTPRTDIMYVVTEYGIVNLKGRTVAERAKLLISIAHPDFREGLERDAYEHRLIPRGFF